MKSRQMLSKQDLFTQSTNTWRPTYYVLGTVLSNGGSKAYSPYATYILVGRRTVDEIK